MNGRWLKKYTELKYAENVLTTCKLHLGDPSSWDDKNDYELIKIYAKAVSEPNVRATCLTTAADRFHFWTVFGHQDSGVCYWFDCKSLIADIAKDETLIARKVLYRKPNTRNEIPFSKREQYSDEKEFRVLKHSRASDEQTSFSFSPTSLRRIYLNAWLSPKQLAEERERLMELSRGHLSHVEIRQSRVIRKRAWIEGARRVAIGR